MRYYWDYKKCEWTTERPEQKKLGPVVKIRSLDYEVDKMDKVTMKRSVETVKRYRHVGCYDQ